MYFLEGSHLSYLKLNNCCVKEDIIIISGHILCRLYTHLICVKRILNSLVNSLSIWQSEHVKESMKNDPVKYKTIVRQLLFFDLETRRNWSVDTSPSSTYQQH